METQFNMNLPPKLREVFGYHVKSISDHLHKEIQPKEVYDIFVRDFVNINDILDVERAVYTDVGDNEIKGDVTITYLGETKTLSVIGNGRLDCVSTAIKDILGLDYVLEDYSQHALEERSSSRAASYVSIVLNGKKYWGTGISSDISKSSSRALVSAINIMLKDRTNKERSK